MFMLKMDFGFTSTQPTSSHPGEDEALQSYDPEAA
jgi:hypothetical protein